MTKPPHKRIFVGVMAKKVTKSTRRAPKKAGAEASSPKVLALPAIDGADSLDGLTELRGQMSCVDKHVFDKAMEALSKDKAMTQWPKMLEMLQDLEMKYGQQSAGEVELDWDMVAVNEAAGA